MALTVSKVTELAPDQESLQAASKLRHPSKWPQLTKNGELVWGECQGSGAHPYRTVFDNSNAGYKCTCPSRKFPCKHVLALMWMYVENPGPFADGEVPQWVTDWLGRRKSPESTSQSNARAKKSSAGKSLITAQLAEIEKPVDPQAEARLKAAAEKRSLATQQSISAGLDELQQWIGDQLRSGLANLLNEGSVSCRTIAARLVDAKAQAMASRLDELPSRLKQVPSSVRLDALIQELGRIVLISRAWQNNPDDAELTRLVGSSEKRESLLALSDVLRVMSVWEVVGELVMTRRDGLVSHATYLMNLGDGNRFALLLDFFPASLGKRSSTFVIGEQFEAELVYYPARCPLRAVIANRKGTELGQSMSERGWPVAPTKPLDLYRDTLRIAPWTDQVPLLLPNGRLAQSGSGWWWQAENASLSLPLESKPERHLAGLSLHQTVALWDGVSLTLLSGQSDWGRWIYEH